MFKKAESSAVALKTCPVNGSNNGNRKEYIKRHILIQLYGSQRLLAEKHTNLALAKCRGEIAGEVAALVACCQAAREAIIRRLTEARFADALIEEIELTSLISEAEHTALQLELAEIISSNIMERFRVNYELKAPDTASDSHNESSVPILNDWLLMKKKSLLIVHELEKCCKKTLTKGIGCVIQSKPLFELAKGLKFSGSFLTGVGVSSKELQVEFCAQLSIRLDAILHSYQLRMIHDYQQQASRIFYQLHDEILESKLIGKIQRQEQWLSNPVYLTAKEA